MFPTFRNVGLSVAVVLALVARARAADPTSQARQTPPAEVRYQSEAHQALAQGEPRRALALLQSRTLQFVPADRRSIEGRAYLLLGDFAVARRKLEGAVRLRPEHASDLYWLGRAYAACEMPALAASRFAESHWRGLDTADLHYHWAAALQVQGESLGRIVQRRLPDEEETSAPAGTFAFGGLVIGPVPARPRKVIVSPPNSAIYHVYRALQQEPKRGDALLLCGEIWAAVDRPQQAVSLFAKAASRLEADEDLARCRSAWAASLLALGRFDTYLRQAREQMQLAGGIDSAELALCYDRVAREVGQRGELRRQIRYLTLAVELSPGVDRLIALSDTLLQAQRADDARGYLQMALKGNPSGEQRRQILLGLQRTEFLASPR